MITVTPNMEGTNLEVFAAAVGNLTGMSPGQRYRIDVDFVINADGSINFVNGVWLSQHWSVESHGPVPTPDFQAYVDDRPVVTKPVFDHLGRLVGQQLVEPILNMREGSLRQRLASVLAGAGPMENRAQLLADLIAEIERGVE